MIINVEASADCPALRPDCQPNAVQDGGWRPGFVGGQQHRQPNPSRSAAARCGLHPGKPRGDASGWLPPVPQLRRARVVR